ncbi:MAG: PKD domain-containing protein [Chitinophagaceae bacterium]|nr:PKD domain-containing protein [Chitinophagaceae bacterium]MBK8952255.1 PKD domain-containing protein [Chitinophagaceae bacterium]
MRIISNSVAIFFFAVLLMLGSCKKEKYTFGDIKTPAELKLTAVVEGVDASNPNGNGTGKVAITVTSTNTLSYNIDFGDGISQPVPSGKITYKYRNPGTYTYTITVNAVGTGGAISTISKQITVFVAFEIPAAILQSITNGSSKVWVTDNDAPGHFGVGPSSEFSPIWYAAGPNTREPCAYDDEITISKDVNNKVFMTINNKGQSFSIGAAAAFYGFSGGDGCYAINTGGTKQLMFMDATSGSTSAVSTMIQFAVPGNGIINFGTGGTTYEILSITNTSLHLRNIGADGNSWYQKLKPKP